MGKDPAFLFYPNDYLGGTMGMTFEEKGAYMELLMMQFNRGHMTEHMIGQTVGQTWGRIQCKFKQDDQGLYYNERLEREVEKRQNYVDSRRNNKLGVNQYTNQNRSYDQTYDHEVTSHMTGHMGNRNRDRDNIDNRGGAGGEEGELLQVEMVPEGDNYKLSTVETKKKRKPKEKKETVEHILFGSQKNVKLTQIEYDQLRSDYPNDASDIVEFLSLHIAEKGDTATAPTHIFTIKKWVVDAVRARKEKGWKGYGQSNVTPAAPEKKPFTYESRIEL